MMRNIRTTLFFAALAVLLPLGGAGRLSAQTPGSRSKTALAAPRATAGESASPDEIQRQLIQLLRMNPKLTSVVARDPSLLTNQEYLNNNFQSSGNLMKLYHEFYKAKR